MNNTITITSPKLKNRNGIIYIDCNTKPFGRLRFSTSLPFSKENCDSIALRIKELVYEFLQVEKPTTNERIFFKDLAQRYLSERCAHLKSQTLLRYQSHINVLAVAFKKDIRLLSQTDLSAFAKLSPKPRMDFVNRLIAYAKDCNIPLRLMPIHLRTQSKIKDIKPFCLSEVKEILNKASGEFRSYLGLAFFSGMRTGEILALTWEDIDFENDKIKIDKSLEQSGKLTTTKTNKARHIDMLAIAKEALQALQSPKSSGRIFTLSRTKLQKEWRALLMQCDLEYRSLYHTRHSFATMMFAHNEEPLWVSAMLGHSSLAITYEHYIRYIPSKKKRGEFVSFGLDGGEKC